MSIQRLALLPLTGAGERECGSCWRLDSCGYCYGGGVHAATYCGGDRLPECLSAERDAARLRKVEVAAKRMFAVFDGRISDAEDPDTAWDALRAALKEP